MNGIQEADLKICDSLEFFYFFALPTFHVQFLGGFWVASALPTFFNLGGFKVVSALPCSIYIGGFWVVSALPSFLYLGGSRVASALPTFFNIDGFKVVSAPPGSFYIGGYWVASALPAFHVPGEILGCFCPSLTLTPWLLLCAVHFQQS